MSKNLKASLIDLGHKVPSVRPEITKVLNSISKTSAQFTEKDLKGISKGSEKGQQVVEEYKNSVKIVEHHQETLDLIRDYKTKGLTKLITRTEKALTQMAKDAVKDPFNPIYQDIPASDSPDKMAKDRGYLYQNKLHKLRLERLGIIAHDSGLVYPEIYISGRPVSLGSYRNASGMKDMITSAGNDLREIILREVENFEKMVVKSKQSAEAKVSGLENRLQGIDAEVQRIEEAQKQREEREQMIEFFNDLKGSLASADTITYAMIEKALEMHPGTTHELLIANSNAFVDGFRKKVDSQLNKEGLARIAGLYVNDSIPHQLTAPKAQIPPQVHRSGVFYKSDFTVLETYWAKGTFRFKAHTYNPLAAKWETKTFSVKSFLKAATTTLPKLISSYKNAIIEEDLQQVKSFKENRQREIDVFSKQQNDLAVEIGNLMTQKKDLLSWRSEKLDPVTEELKNLRLQRSGLTTSVAGSLPSQSDILREVLGVLSRYARRNEMQMSDESDSDFPAIVLTDKEFYYLTTGYDDNASEWELDAASERYWSDTVPRIESGIKASLDSSKHKSLFEVYAEEGDKGMEYLITIDRDKYSKLVQDAVSSDESSEDKQEKLSKLQNSIEKLQTEELKLQQEWAKKSAEIDDLNAELDEVKTNLQEVLRNLQAVQKRTLTLTRTFPGIDNPPVK